MKLDTKEIRTATRKEYEPYFVANIYISPYQEAIRISDVSPSDNHHHRWEWSRILKFNAPMWEAPKSGQYYDVSLQILSKVISKEDLRYLKLDIRRMKYRMRKKK